MCQLVARFDKVSRVHVGMLVGHVVVREGKSKGRTTYVRLCDDNKQMISCSWVWLKQFSHTVAHDPGFWLVMLPSSSLQ
jgi:hypothetical protein